MQAFADDADEQFTRRIMEHLHQFYAESVSLIHSEDLRREVNERKARARAYGLTGQAAIVAFIALTFGVGPHFDLQPAIQAVLTDCHIEPDERVEVLVTRVQRSDWAKAAQL